MPDHRTPMEKYRLTILLGMILMLFGPSLPARADVVHFKELLPFVDIKIPGWTMQGKPSGTTLKQGNVMVSEARVTFKAGDQTLEVVIMDFLGKPIPFIMGQPLEMASSAETIPSTKVQGVQGPGIFSPPGPAG